MPEIAGFTVTRQIKMLMLFMSVLQTSFIISADILCTNFNVFSNPCMCLCMLY